MAGNSSGSMKNVGVYAPYGRVRITNLNVGGSVTTEKPVRVYLIGLDLGDGESCLSYVSSEDSLETNRPIFSLNKKDTIPTAIAEIDDEIVIGEKAFVRPDAVELTVNFKSNPTLDKKRWKLRRDDILSFVETFFEKFSQKHPKIAENCEIFIGCPSSWSEESRGIYEQNFLDSEELPVCHVVPESRAALIQALDVSRKSNDQDSEQQLRDLIHKRVLLIDIGSSTTDVTVLDNLEPFEIEIGGNLGLGLVDKQLRETIYRKYPEGKTFERRIREDRREEQFLLYLCRLAKEHTFGCDVNPSNFFKQREWAEDCWEFLLSTNLHNCLVDKFFWEDAESWLDRYQSLLKDIQASALVGKPDVVIITGGGSNIQQLRSETGKAFPSALLVQDPEPSLSIARGLAGYGQWCVNVENFYSDSITLIQSSNVDSEVYSELNPIVGEIAYHFRKSWIHAVWHPMAYQWKDGKLNLHEQGGLYSYALKLYRKWLNEGNKSLFEPALDCLSEVANRALREDIKKLGDRYGLPVDSFKIRLEISPIEFFMSESPGGDLISKVTQAYSAYENVGFQIVDQVPTPLRKLAHSTGLLDFALKSEEVMENILATVIGAWYGASVSLEMRQRIIKFVRDEAKREVDKQLGDVEKLLLESHRPVSNGAR